MGDDEVQNEMKKMVAFIKQEALEKAREIKVKAEEDFAIEKAKIVRSESINIDSTIEKKKKQAEVQRKVAGSTMKNKSRLAILQSRQQLLNDLFEETSNRLKDVPNDKAKYQQLLKDLILQGLYQLMEPNVSVMAREADIDIVKEAIKEAEQKYSQDTDDHVKVELVQGNYLPKENAGGVVLAGYHGRIQIDNTLDARLITIQEQLLPEIRTALFGPNPNRRFHN